MGRQRLPVLFLRLFLDPASLTLLRVPLPDNVEDIPDWEFGAIDMALEHALSMPRGPIEHPYGEGRAGELAAHVLASFKPEHHPLRKRNSY